MVRIRIGEEEYDLTWEEWEARVRGGRVPPDALVRFEAVTGGQFVVAEELELYRSLRNDAAIAWQGQLLSGPPPVLTALLVGLQIRIWWFARLPEVADRLVLDYTNWTAPALEDGQTWRMVTMGLLHTDPFHLVLNMLWLAYTGWNLESALGRANLAVLYFGSVIGGSLLSMLLSPETPSLGASGGVFGLVAASVVFGFTRPELLPERARRWFGLAMAPYLVVMFSSGLMNEGTDNWSHFGGLLVGGALAIALDPEPLQRSVGWNRRWHVAVASSCAAVLLAFGLAGPRLYPLWDSERAARAHLPAASRLAAARADDDETKALAWRVPAGWRTGVTATGDSGFVSPYPAGDRVWSVRDRKLPAPATPEGVRADLVETLRRGWPDAQVGPLTETEVGGRAGWRADVSLGSENAPRLEWRFVVRGVWVLQEVWQVDAWRGERLSPLRDRLRATVSWGDPPALVEARAAADRTPESPKARADLATALAEVGEVEAALGIWKSLVADRPEDPAVWAGFLQTIRWYPEGVPARDAIWDEALSQHDLPALVLEVVAGLEADGRETEARGLLDLAWARSPGDKKLKAARRSRNLPRELDVARHLPWELVHDPLTGAPRSDEEVLALRNRPLALAEAKKAGEARGAFEAALVTQANAAMATGGDPWTPMLLLKHGAPPADRRAALEGLLEDARTRGGGGEVAWMPEGLALTADAAERLARAIEEAPAPPP